MATSTIFANIEIKDAKTAERFVAALEESEKEKDRKSSVQAYPILTDLDEIRKLVAKRNSAK